MTATAIGRELGVSAVVVKRALREIGARVVNPECVVCTHPQEAEITRAIVNEGVVPTMQRFGIKRNHLFKHRKHLGLMISFEHDKILAEERVGGPDLAKVRQLLGLMKRTAAQAKDARDFKAAAVAGKVAFSCAELLITGGARVAKNGGAKGVEKPADERPGLPTTYAELDAQVAAHVKEMTNNFDAAEIERLRAITTAASSAPPPVPAIADRDDA
jgi:hypothetical protein